jgi:vacuolar iron transporter family protein
LAISREGNQLRFRKCREWPPQLMAKRGKTSYKHKERHKTERIGWLRAAVLGANDGIVSTSSLLIGVATAGSSHNSLIIAGTAGLVAGAMSMAAGEYVSVYSQADTEKADLAKETRELEADPEGEMMELAGIYVGRGLEPRLARQVAEQMMLKDALGAHARDELGITETMSAQPLQAAIFSAASFSVGAALPLLVAFLLFGPLLIPALSLSSLVFLGILGGVAARAGGANVWAGSLRVLFWGAVAMGATAIVGKLFGTVVS